MPRGGFVSADESGGQYQNEIETDRSWILDALGGNEGILRGYTATPASGSLALDYTPGAAVFTGAETTDQGAYYIWDAAATVVGFDPPDLQSRVDAVVVGCRDPQYGSVPSGTVAGPFREVVKGTPGASPVPPDDATVDAAVGPGVWRREHDVQIDPGDTVVNPANITSYDLAATKPVPYAKIIKNTSQVIEAATNGESVTFQVAEEESRSGMADLANDQIVVPTDEDGLYLIEASGNFSLETGSGIRVLLLKVNGARVSHQMAPSSTGVATGVSVSTLKRLTAGDTIGMDAISTGDSPDLNTAVGGTHLSIIKVAD